MEVQVRGHWGAPDGCRGGVIPGKPKGEPGAMGQWDNGHWGRRRAGGTVPCHWGADVPGLLPVDRRVGRPGTMACTQPENSMVSPTHPLHRWFTGAGRWRCRPGRGGGVALGVARRWCTGVAEPELGKPFRTAYFGVPSIFGAVTDWFHIRFLCFQIGIALASPLALVYR